MKKTKFQKERKMMETTHMLKNLGKTALLALLITFSIKPLKADVFEWTFETQGPILSTLTIENNVAYFGSHDTYFYAVDVNGNELWKFKTEYGIKSKAAIFENTVCFLAGNRLFGLDKTSGELLWKHEPENVKSKTPTIHFDEWDYKDSSPTLRGSTAYYGNEYGSIYGIDLTNGAQIFEYHSTTKVAYRIKTAIASDTIYAGNRNGVLYAINLNDASLIWTKYTFSENKPYPSFGGLIGDIVIDGDNLLFGARNNVLQSINRFTKASDWEYQNGGTWISGIPILKGDTLFVGSSDSHELIALNNSDGSQLWKQNVKNGIYNKPILYKNHIITVTGDESYPEKIPGVGRVYIHDFDGNLKNSILLSGSVFGTPQIVGDKIYFGTRDNKVHCISLEKYIASAEINIEFENENIELGDIGDEKLFEIFSIKNTGTQSLNLDLTFNDSDFPSNTIRFFPSSLAVSVGETVLVKIRISKEKMDFGSHTVNLDLTSNSDENITYHKAINFEKTIPASVKKELAVESELLVFPNPSSKNFNLNISHLNKSQASYTITNLNGQQLEQNTLNQEIENIEIGKNLPSGIYLVNVNCNGTIQTARIVKN